MNANNSRMILYCRQQPVSHQDVQVMLEMLISTVVSKKVICFICNKTTFLGVYIIYRE